MSGIDCGFVGCKQTQYLRHGACPDHAGYTLRTRWAVCSNCTARAYEHLVTTALSPQGVWVLNCRKCGT